MILNSKNLNPKHSKHSNHIFIYPLVNKQKAIENGPVEIVDLPSYKNGGSFLYVNVYQAGYIEFGDGPWIYHRDPATLQLHDLGPNGSTNIQYHMVYHTVLYIYIIIYMVCFNGDYRVSICFTFSEAFWSRSNQSFIAQSHRLKAKCRLDAQIPTATALGNGKAVKCGKCTDNVYNILYDMIWYYTIIYIYIYAYKIMKMLWRSWEYMRICCHCLPKRFTDSKISEAFTIWASWSVRSGTLGCSFAHINYTLVVKQPLWKMMEFVKWDDDIDDIPWPRWWEK